MSYIRQGQLFSFEEFVEIDDDNTRLALVLDALPDERLIRWLKKTRKGKRDDYPLEMLWRCVVAKFVYQIKTYAELIRELKRNGSLRRMVGIESIGTTPEDYHFSRFLNRLSRPEGLKHLRRMFEMLVKRLSERIPEFGKHLAIDGTAIHAYSNENKAEASDRDAEWGGRNKRGEEDVEYWLGYIGHFVVDCETELPVAFDLQPANDSEMKRMKPMLEDLKQRQPAVTERTEAVMADRGYDATYNYEYIYDELDALPIIKMTLTEEPDEQSEAAWYLCNGLGTPTCLSGHTMVYWGRDGDHLKWRCPAQVRSDCECTRRSRCSASEYGPVKKIKFRDHIRRLPGIGRQTNKFERLYNKRTAAERVNGRLKEYLLADDLTVRGLAKGRAHLSIGLLVMLAGSWAMASQDKLEKARQIVRLAA